MITTNKNLRNKVIYQIFTRNYKDGNFKAVKNDLDRIKSLGVDIIYLLPINPSGEEHRKGSLGSPYAIKNYREIDPAQGTLEDFIDLSETIHAKGMKLIIDIVYNHTSPDSYLAQNHPEWFYHKEDGSFGNRIGDWWDVIDLDYSNKELWKYQIDTLKMWAKYVDGFRCDVAPMVSIEFWKEAVRQVEEVRPGCIWIAEAVEPEFIRANRLAGVPTSTDAELYQTFDICYDYDIYNDMKAAIMGEGDLSEYIKGLNRQELIYPDNYIKLRCLENHDRPRAAMLIPDDGALINWTGFNYFIKGTVMLYAGQENQVTHHPTLFDEDKVCFDTGKDISTLISRLSEIKRDEVFAEGIFEASLTGTNGEVIIARYRLPKGVECEHSEAVGIFSTTGRATSCKVSLPNGIYINEIDGKQVDIYEETMALDGNPVVIIL